MSKQYQDPVGIEMSDHYDPATKLDELLKAMGARLFFVTVVAVLVAAVTICVGAAVGCLS